jgi:hypothetical protein
LAAKESFYLSFAQVIRQMGSWQLLQQQLFRLVGATFVFSCFPFFSFFRIDQTMRAVYLGRTRFR